MSRPTAAQIDALLDFLDEHRDLARDKLKSIDGRMQSHRLWEELTTTLNAIGGCIKTTKQWQKVWRDKRNLAKEAAAAAWWTVSATEGGPSMTSLLSQWELKIVSIMGYSFGERETSARSLVFFEIPSQVDTAAPTDTPSNQEVDFLLNETPSQQETSQPASATPDRNASTTNSQLTSTRRRRKPRRHPETLQVGSSVRDRLFKIENRRLILEKQRNVEIAGIRMAVVELCRLTQQVIEQWPPRNNVI